MLNRQVAAVSLPSPSVWSIDAWVGGRPQISGTLTISSVTNNVVRGSINFRGTNLPIEGYWNQSIKQITFQSQYANYVGTLISVFDEPATQNSVYRHYVIRGTLVQTPPSIHAGEHGTWVATNDVLIKVR